MLKIPDPTVLIEAMAQAEHDLTREGDEHHDWAVYLYGTGGEMTQEQRLEAEAALDVSRRALAKALSMQRADIAAVMAAGSRLHTARWGHGIAPASVWETVTEVLVEWMDTGSMEAL